MSELRHYAWGVADKYGNHELNTTIELDPKHICAYVNRINNYPKEYRNGPYKVVELFCKVPE